LASGVVGARNWILDQFDPERSRWMLWLPVDAWKNTVFVALSNAWSDLIHKFNTQVRTSLVVIDELVVLPGRRHGVARELALFEPEPKGQGGRR
jgi:hypothetical protein